MNKLFIQLFFLTMSVAVFGQDYQPFKARLSYQFLNASHDTIQSFQINSVTNGIADTIFTFNPVVRGEFHFEYLDSNNVFGSKMIKKSNGDYYFLTQQKDSFLIKTKTALRSKWTFSKKFGIEATYLEKKFAEFLGIKDSIIIISLSDGNSIEISKNYGIISSINFSHYFNNNIANSYSLDAIAEIHLGKFLSDPYIYYDFNEGDVFTYFTTLTGQIGNKQYARTRKRILSRKNYGRDSIVYTIEQKEVFREYNDSFLSKGNRITEDTIVLKITGKNNLEDEYQYSDYQIGGLFLLTEYPFKFSSHPRVKTKIFKGNFDKYTFELSSASDFETGFANTYSPGLGSTMLSSYYSGNGYERSVETLECFSKGNEKVGDCSFFDQIQNTLAENDIQDLRISTIQEDLFIQFPEETKQDYIVQLYNCLGNKLLESPLKAGNIQCLISTSGISSGVYLIVLSGGKPYRKSFVKY